MKSNNKIIKLSVFKPFTRCYSDMIILSKPLCETGYAYDAKNKCDYNITVMEYYERCKHHKHCTRFSWGSCSVCLCTYIITA